MKNDQNIPPDTLKEGNTLASADQIEQLHAQMQDMQMGIDILKETINVLKKDSCIDQNVLKNRCHHLVSFVIQISFLSS